MKFSACELSGVTLIEPTVHSDERGFFLESYQAQKYAEGGIRESFVQDNHSRSLRGTLRGLHAQLGERAQAKLVRVVVGSVFDVAVDIRVGSPTFGRWVGYEISADNFRQLFIPTGFAHGFCVTSEVAEFEYKCTNVYEPSAEIVIAWDDPAIGIRWPVEKPLLSARDTAAASLAEQRDRLPRYDA